MISLTLSERSQRMLREMPQMSARFAAAIMRTLDVQNQLSIGHVTQHHLTGTGPFPPAENRLGVRTNRLRSSLRASKARPEGNEIVSAIGSNVVYAAIHEFGGQTRPHIIRAKPGKSLAFFVKGGKFSAITGKMVNAALRGLRGKARSAARTTFLSGAIFRQQVNHPGSKMPARRWLSTGIAARAPHYIAALDAALEAEWNNVG